MTVPTQDNQAFVPGALVTLFVLDATALGGSVHRFCPSTDANQTSVFWGGIEYPPMPIIAEGFEHTGKGTLPSPTLRVTNVLGGAATALINYGDLVGATVTRYRTYSKYLDGGDEEDSSVMLPPDVFKVDCKTHHSKLYIEWELRAAIDQEGVRLPGRQMLRDTCPHRYRVWNGSAFDYTNATCPYTGTDYFKADGTTCTADLDVCGKKFTDCELRFTDGDIPYKGFPGIGRTRVS